MNTPLIRITADAAKRVPGAHALIAEVRDISGTTASMLARKLEVIGETGKITTPMREVYRIPVVVKRSLRCDAIAAVEGALGPHAFRDVPELA